MASITDKFFDAVARVASAATPSSIDITDITQLATVEDAYTGAGDPRVRFDGETVVSPRSYTALLPVKAGDRVVMLKVGNSWVVIGAPTSPGDARWLPGDVKTTMRVAADVGWLMMKGGTFLMADYPALAGVIPAAWISGANFILPDMSGKGTVGADGTYILGVTGGSSTSTVLIAHVHTGTSHTHSGPSHSHGMSHSHNHSHSGTTGGINSNHQHSDMPISGGPSQMGAGGIPALLWVNGYQPGGTAIQDHGHAFGTSSDGTGASTGATGSEGTENTGSGGTGNTGSAGAGVNFSLMQPYLSVNYMIKT